MQYQHLHLLRLYSSEPFNSINCLIHMRISISLLISILLFSSSYAQTLNGFDLSNALVEPSEVKKGGPAKDGIPALNYPQFLQAQDADYIQESDLVIGISIENDVKAYPIRILNWHEIVNDTINNNPVVITYCPLCGSGIVFNSIVNKVALTFGVSGLLYNSDVLLYDKQTESLWSQIMSKSINGKQKGQKLEIITSDLTTWGQWVGKHPNTLVLSTNTGYNRNYNKDPYSGYTSTEQTYFPVHIKSDKVPAKERVLGIQIKNSYKAYPYSELAKGNGIIEDEFKGIKIKIQYHKDFQTATLISPIDIISVSSYWFAWYAFHPYTKVYKN